MIGSGRAAPAARNLPVPAELAAAAEAAIGGLQIAVRQLPGSRIRILPPIIYR
jgi:hypothetical protein